MGNIHDILYAKGQSSGALFNIGTGNLEEAEALIRRALASR